jgi:hypothetical protein
LLQSRFTSDSPVPLRSARSGPWHWPLWLGARFRRQARAPKARPYGLRGLTAQRAQASGHHAKNTEKRSLGPGVGLPNLRLHQFHRPSDGTSGELGFIQPRSSFSYQLPQLSQDVKSLFVWSTSNKQLLCLMYKYEQHTASLLWHDGPRWAAQAVNLQSPKGITAILRVTATLARFMPRLLAGDYSSFQTGVPQTWVTTLGPKGLSRGCKVFCSRST